jgi:hypothetical protein
MCHHLCRINELVKEVNEVDEGGRRCYGTEEQRDGAITVHERSGSSSAVPAVAKMRMSCRFFPVPAASRYPKIAQLVSDKTQNVITTVAKYDCDSIKSAAICLLNDHEPFAKQFCSDLSLLLRTSVPLQQRAIFTGEEG